MKKLIKMIAIIVAVAISLSFTANAQVAINTDGTDPDGSAMLDVKSTDKGFMPPRVANVNDVSNPAAGLLVYDQSVNCMRYYNGTAWSECMGKPFSCGDPFMDTRNGKVYNTVQIGAQCWMAENLNIGTMINVSNNQTDNDTIEKYCYGNNTTNCDTYGGLYQWDEIMQYVSDSATQGICPDGLHIPTDNEWTTLENYLINNGYGWGGDGNDIAKSIASTSGWRTANDEGKVGWQQNLNNSSGFNTLAAGHRSISGTFIYLRYDVHFWSSTLLNGMFTYIRRTSFNSYNISREFQNNPNGFSLRCIKD